MVESKPVGAKCNMYSITSNPAYSITAYVFWVVDPCSSIGIDVGAGSDLRDKASTHRPGVAAAKAQVALQGQEACTAIDSACFKSIARSANWPTRVAEGLGTEG